MSDSTLFERVAGIDKENKISIHLIQSLMTELGGGRRSLSDVDGILGLTTQQSQDFARVLTAGHSSTNGAVFAQRIFAYLLLAESSYRAKNNGLASYLVEVNFWDMVDAEALK